MKTNITCAMILLVLLSACASNPPAEPTVASVNKPVTTNAPTGTLRMKLRLNTFDVVRR